MKLPKRSLREWFRKTKAGNYINYKTKFNPGEHIHQTYRLAASTTNPNSAPRQQRKAGPRTGFHDGRLPASTTASPSPARDVPSAGRARYALSAAAGPRWPHHEQPAAAAAAAATTTATASTAATRCTNVLTLPPSPAAAAAGWRLSSWPSSTTDTSTVTSDAHDAPAAIAGASSGRRPCTSAPSAPYADAALPRHARGPSPVARAQHDLQYATECK